MINEKNDPQQRIKPILSKVLIFNLFELKTQIS